MTQDAKTGPAASQRITQLDGLRGIAACIVAFAYHSQNLFATGSFTHYGPVVNWLHQWGWSVVDLFFLLSGYIIAHVYLRDPASGARFNVAGFAIARIARLYPLHLALLLPIAACAWRDPANTPLAFVAHLFMLQAFVNPVGHSFDGPSWSLSVECVCYTLFAWGLWRGPRALVWVTGLAFGVGLGWIATCSGLGGPWGADVMPRALLGFFLGQMLWRWRGALGQISTPLLIALLTTGLLADVGQWSPLLPLCLLAWPAALLVALRLPLLKSRALLWLGDRSYAIYLLHLPLIGAIESWTGPISGSVWQVAGIHAALIMIVLVLADIAFRRIEEPAKRAIRARSSCFFRADGYLVRL